MKVEPCKWCGAHTVSMPMLLPGTWFGKTWIAVDAATVRPGDDEWDHTRHVSHVVTCTDPPSHCMRNLPW